MVRQKEAGVRFDKIIVFRATEGMYNYLQDFADEEDGDISKIVRGIIEIHMSEKAGDEYYLIDRIKDMIKHHEEEIDKLEDLKSNI